MAFFKNRLPRPPKLPRQWRRRSLWSLLAPSWLLPGQRGQMPKPPRARKKKDAAGWKLPFPSWQMLPALLALLFTGGVFLAAVTGLLRPGAADFEKRFVAARAAGDWKEAVIWLRRQLAADPTALEARMHLVETYAALSDTRAMVDILNQIAPGSALVYGPAHLYRARLMLAGGSADPKIRMAVKTCLELARRADPAKGQGTVDPVAIAELMVDVLVAEGNWSGALELAAEIPKPSPATRLMLGKSLKNLGRHAEARAAVDEAVAALDAAASGNSLEERFSRTAFLAQAFLLKGDRESAVDSVLAAGDGPEFKALQASVIYLAAENYRSEAGWNSALWLDCVVKGLVAVPDDFKLTGELLTGAGRWADLPGFGAGTRQRLTESGLDAHLLLLSGISSLMENKPDQAFVQFRKAWELLPGNPVIANNHALLLAASQASGAPVEALAIIDGVLDQYPSVAPFLDTKGRILLRIGSFEEAVVVLELALKSSPDRATHAALAEAYTGLGQTELAGWHRELSVRK